MAGTVVSLGGLNREQVIALIVEYANTVDVTRVTGATTLDEDHHHVFCDTDSADIAITLPAGVADTEYRVCNTGTSGNKVTITPDGSELLIGENSAFTLNDGESLIVAYEATEGWA